MLTTLLDAVTLQLWRRARRRQRLPRSGQARGERHLERYRQLIETRFAEQPSIPDLAAELGIGDAHLNALCRRLTGHSALQLLHARLLLGLAGVARVLGTLGIVLAHSCDPFVK